MLLDFPSRNAQLRADLALNPAGSSGKETRAHVRQKHVPGSFEPLVFCWKALLYELKDLRHISGLELACSS